MTFVQCEMEITYFHKTNEIKSNEMKEKNVCAAAACEQLKYHRNVELLTSSANTTNE